MFNNNEQFERFNQLFSPIQLKTRVEDVINEAWDLFSEHIGENKLETPLELYQFDEIFDLINKSNKFTHARDEILRSFRYDSYLWPLVKKSK